MTGRRSPRAEGCRAPALRRTACTRCGSAVDAFLDPETGLTVRLDPEPPSVDRDLTGMRGLVFEYRGPRVGWVSKWDPGRRGWREMRTVHECATRKESR